VPTASFEAACLLCPRVQDDADRLNLGVVGPQCALPLVQQLGELVPSSSRVTCQPREGGKVVPDGKQVGVVPAENSIGIDQDLSEHVPGRGWMSHLA
jgi:hypothetical protein